MENHRSDRVGDVDNQECVERSPTGEKGPLCPTRPSGHCKKKQRHARGIDHGEKGCKHVAEAL